MSEEQAPSKVISMLQKIENDGINVDKLFYAAFCIGVALLLYGVSFAFAWPIGLIIRQLCAAGFFITAFVFTGLACRKKR